MYWRGNYWSICHRLLDGLCAQVNNFYTINYDQYYVKTKDVVVESYFENNVIFEALKKAGFKNIQIVDHNLSPISGENLEYTDRIHVIAMKK